LAIDEARAPLEWRAPLSGFVFSPYFSSLRRTNLRSREIIHDSDQPNPAGTLGLVNRFAKQRNE